MHKNEQVIHDFYTSFQKRDPEGMCRCYAPTIVFSDPVFTHLEGAEVRSMWRMVTARARDFSLTYRDVVADDRQGSAHWEADYTFSKTGRRVHNVIDATFTFQDGLIVRHTDRFDLWRWMGMALGLPGVLLGWLPPLRRKVRAQALDGLHQFIDAQRG